VSGLEYLPRTRPCVDEPRSTGDDVSRRAEGVVRSVADEAEPERVLASADFGQNGKQGLSLVGDSSPIRRPPSPSSQYAVASSISTIEGWLRNSLKARMRSSSERAGFVRMSFELRGAPRGDDANSTGRPLGVATE
jgi:hypothetical protein